MIQAEFETKDPDHTQRLCTFTLIYLRRHEFERIRGLDRSVLSDMLRTAVQRAQGHGFETPRDVIDFVLMMFEFGPAFDEHAEIRKLFAETRHVPGRSMQELIDRFPGRALREAECSRGSDAWSAWRERASEAAAKSTHLPPEESLVRNATPAGLRAMEGTAPCVSASLAQFEQQIGATLPEEYRQFLLQHNGGQPVPACFRINWNGQAWARRFPYDDVDWLYGIDRKSYVDLLSTNACFAGRIPRNMIAIGHDAGANQILLGIRGVYLGQVLFWAKDYECEEGDVPDTSNVGFVAASFSAFLDGLADG